MPFGSERRVIESSRLRRLLWALRGDFHIGRWIRHFHLRRVLDTFPIKPTRVLDAGCGTGQSAFYLAKRFPSSSVEGIDVSATDIGVCEAIAKALGSTSTFQVRDLQHFGGAKEYDLVLMNNVLYAILDYRLALCNVLRSVSEGGWIVIQEMNISYLRQKFGQDLKNIRGAVRMGLTFDDLFPLLEKHEVKVCLAQVTMGSLAELAHTLFSRTRTAGLLRNLIFPFLLLLAYLDALVVPNKGSGILLVGRKTRSAESDGSIPKVESLSI